MFTPRRIIRIALGLALMILGIILNLRGSAMYGIIPFLIGGSLIYLGMSKSRVATLVFGHVCVALGCYLVTWGILLLPYSEPKLSHIFLRPLFWGLFSMFGGICAIFHGFCNCVMRRGDDMLTPHSHKNNK